MRRFSLIVAAFLAILSAHAVGCTLPRDGRAPKQCTADSECDDGNPCTESTCSPEGLCDDIAVVVELPQVPNDCRQDECVDGEIAHLPLDSDVEDKLCSRDSCDDGEPVHVEEPDGTNCVAPEGAGRCVAGECKVECDPGDPCDDSVACTVDSCNALTGLCDHDPLDNVPAPLQADGDCRLVVCDAGIDNSIFDDGDLPVDDNPCTDDLCIQGEPSNPGVPIGEPCSLGGDEQLCDGAGTCVECIGIGDCTLLVPIVEPDCAERTCIAGACGRSDEPAGTPLNPANQTLGDCVQQVCDGAGNIDTSPLVDNNDIPFDSNDCTEDACTNGVPSNNNESPGTACGASGVCNATGQCVGCNGPTDCGANTDCLTWACNATVCQPLYTPNGTPTSNQTPQNCLTEVCNGAGQAVVVSANDPIVDGNPCTQDNCVSGMPQNPPQNLDTPCNGTMFCNGTGVCVQCNNHNQCSSDDGVCEADNCLSNSCTIVDDPAGSPAPSGLQTSGDCETVVCDGNGNVNPTPQIQNADVPVDGNQCTEDHCTNGNPQNPPEPAETPCMQSGGIVCNGIAPAMCVECATDNQCGAGETCNTATWTCLEQNGQPCATGAECLSNLCVDGVCCNSSCSGLCQACNVSGSLGTCSAVPFNQDPAGECVNGSCNGLGACKLADGQTCSTGSQCLSDECRDGVCCDGTCSGLCEACNVTGSVGACSFVPFNTDPASECANGSCNGAGLCKLAQGQGCMVGGDCLSGFCRDGVCCNSACAGTCQSCATGACTAYTAGTDPEAECPGADVCNGNNQCRCIDGLQNGSETDTDCGGGVCPTCAAGDSCVSPSDCASGVCTGNVCQAASCGDGVVNGTEVCDFANPATPCCSGTCAGTAALGVVCGADPDGSGCGAPPECSGMGQGIAHCLPETQVDGVSCTTDGLFCNGSEQCFMGMCTSPGDPCPIADGDADCMEACNDTLDMCVDPEPNNTACVNGAFNVCCSGACNATTMCP